MALHQVLVGIGADQTFPVSEEGKGEIQLTSEDYLQGVIGMVNELVSPFSRSPFSPMPLLPCYATAKSI